jgi:hypothetical protein
MNFMTRTPRFSSATPTHRTSCGLLERHSVGEPHVAVINQADCAEELEKAQSLGKKLLELGVARVVITSYPSDEPVKELLLH